MLQNLGFLFLGIVGVLFGAWLAVLGSQKIAKGLHLHDAFVGLTILSIGTSFPEIATHVASSIHILNGIDASGVAVGANIGSNIIQITFITGIIAILTTIQAKGKGIRRDYLVMLAAILLLWIFSVGGVISKFEGAVLVTGYIIYLIHLIRNEKVFAKVKEEENEHKFHHYLKYSVYIISGLSLLWYFANIVVDNALILSDTWGVSGSLIGALIVGVGTALPEFTTAVVAIIRGAGGMSLGTLIGSNITNPLFAIGIGAIISGYKVGSEIIWFDLPFWFLISVLGYYFFRKDFKINKKEGMVLVGSYILFVGIRLKLGL